MAHQPQNLTATATSQTTIVLSWDDVETLEDETYDVERDGATIEASWAGGTTYTDTGLSADTEYTYRVRAVGGTVVAVPELVGGLVAWYDFAVAASNLWQDTARTSAITAGGQMIKGVTDKSGNGKHLSEATNGPTYTTAAINGLSVARFDGTNDVLTNAVMVADTSFTMFLVLKKRSASPVGVTNDVAFAAGSVATQLYSNAEAGSGEDWKYYSDSGGGVVQLSTSEVQTLAAMTFRINSAASLDVYVNGGTAQNFNPDDGITTGTSFTYGNNAALNSPGDVDYGEIIIYNSALSATDMNLIGIYLERWGLTWSDVS